MTPGDMLFIEHLNELRKRFFRIIIVTLSVVFFSFIFGIQLVHINDLAFYFIYPSVYNNISSQITLLLSKNLVPEGVKLIQTAPGQSLYAQIYVSILLGITCSIPIIVKEIFGFVNPAISDQTKKLTLFRLIFPITILFLSGILFSYYLAIPLTLTFLYQYGQSLGVLSFLNINEFISFVLQFFIAFGISFQLPLIMYILSLSGLIGLNFWIKNFKYALIIIIIFGAFVTPDGSGVTMWFIAIPMIVLYLIGILSIKIHTGRKKII